MLLSCAKSASNNPHFGVIKTLEKIERLAKPVYVYDSQTNEFIG